MSEYYEDDGSVYWYNQTRARTLFIYKNYGRMLGIDLPAEPEMMKFKLHNGLSELVEKKRGYIFMENALKLDLCVQKIIEAMAEFGIEYRIIHMPIGIFEYKQKFYCVEANHDEVLSNLKASKSRMEAYAHTMEHAANFLRQLHQELVVNPAQEQA